MITPNGYDLAFMLAQAQVRIEQLEKELDDMKQNKLHPMKYYRHKVTGHYKREDELDLEQLATRDTFWDEVSAEEYNLMMNYITAQELSTMPQPLGESPLPPPTSEGTESPHPDTDA